MLSLPETTGSTGPRFLVTREKVSRGIFGLAGIVALITGGIFVFPYITQFATLGIEAGYKLAVFAAMLAAFAGVFTVVTNKSIQNAIWYMYMGWVDAIALRVAKVNPVARVKAYVSHYLEPMQARCQDILNRASGRLKSAQTRFDENQKSLAAAQRRAEYCLDHGSRDGGKTWADQKLRTEFTVQSQKVRMMKEAVISLQKNLDFQKGCVMILQNLQNVIAAYTEVTKFNVEMLVQKFESTSEMAEGSRDVQGMLGSSEQRKMYEMSAKSLEDQTNMMMAEVEGVMKIVQTQIVSGQIDDNIAEEDLIKQLNLRVDTMSTFAENQRQLAASGEPVLLNNAQANIQEGVLVERKQIQNSSDSPNRFGNLLPPRQ